MRDYRLMAIGMVTGGVMSRVFVAPQTVIAYLVAAVAIYGLLELAVYLARHLRWQR